MSIKLELPEENPIALKHMGLALQNIAAEMKGETVGTPIISKVTVTDPATIALLKEGTKHNISTGYVVDIDEPIDFESIDEVVKADTDTTVDEQYASLAEDGVNTVVQDDTPPPPPSQSVNSVDVDSTGLPHDQRIHSREKTKNANGEWKLRRKPSDFATKEAWLSQVKHIQDQLRAAMNADTSATPPPPVENSVEQAGFGADTTPPPPSDTKTVYRENRHFPELMRLVTSNTDKDAPKKVQQIIADLGLGSLQTLNSCGVDKVTDVYYALEAVL